MISKSFIFKIYELSSLAIIAAVLLDFIIQFSFSINSNYTITEYFNIYHEFPFEFSLLLSVIPYICITIYRYIISITT